MGLPCSSKIHTLKKKFLNWTVGTKQYTVRKERKLRGLAFIYDNDIGNQGLMLAMKEFHLVAEEGGMHCCEHVNHLCSQLKIYSTPPVFA